MIKAVSYTHLDVYKRQMLTGETAVGKYPVRAMNYLVKTAQAALRRLPGR